MLVTTELWDCRLVRYGLLADDGTEPNHVVGSKAHQHRRNYEGKMSRRIDLAVPYEEKDEAKQYEVEWDEENRVWWTTEEHMCEELERWLPYFPSSKEVVESLSPLHSTQAEREHVQLLSQNCEFKEWMLLMLPDGLWGAFWRDDLETCRASYVIDGDYAKGCRYVSASPTETITYMRDNRLYLGALRDGLETTDVELPICYGSLTIGGRTIDIELPWLCAHLMEHMSEHTPVPPKDSDIACEIFRFLDSNTTSQFKFPLIEQLAKAEEISQKLRVPLPKGAHENRMACQEFIDTHSADLTMYKAIRRHLDVASRPVTKRINNYVRWLFARTMLSQGIPWESIAEQLAVKTKATIEKYAAQADEAERETPELLTAPFYQELVKVGLAGNSVDLAVSRMVDAEAWDEFSHERQVRRKLKATLRQPA
ncbi:hypothetical protein E0D86_12055 [Pseudomonas sp. IC_126]|uniref:DUF5710 domain-containing protein n=1 Tax=Pseudomonas sp. IC_126 TaxID=2547400 RepID=UPI00103EB252|nr:DUF5710 domain-containing protein [Pseudomonas sp. IC_126]TCD21341.1 hypothetical protein E0D86_12055 [Pseudomonas sp. IC_126]